MTLGRTSSGAIKIKTDGGLRAVNCGCCQSGPFDPCEDCPPFIRDLNFSVSGDFSGWVQTFNYEPALGADGQTCLDSCDGYSPAGSGNGFATHGVTLRREYITGQGGLVCGWVLGMGYNTQEETIDPSGFPSFCDFSAFEELEITALDPRGTYTFNITGPCSGLSWDGMPFQEQRSYNFTVIIS